MRHRDGDGKEEWVLKVLVGSRAHGLATATSDFDYRGVFVQPTEEILSLHGTTKQTSWIEGRPTDQAGSKEDDTGWEIGHFLKLALQCNPTILETFAAPVELATWEGEGLRALFPAIWHPLRVKEAFVGYGLNQRKKFLEGKDARPHKYATAYLRTLVQAETLLTHGVLLVDLTRHEEFQTLQLFRTGMVTVGQVIDKCLLWEDRVRDALETGHAAKHQQPNLAKVDEFLLGVRRQHWGQA